jgi:hypothetical protein
MAGTAYPLVVRHAEVQSLADRAVSHASNFEIGERSAEIDRSNGAHTAAPIDAGFLFPSIGFSRLLQ